VPFGAIASSNEGENERSIDKKEESKSEVLIRRINVSLLTPRSKQSAVIQCRMPGHRRCTNKRNVREERILRRVQTGFKAVSEHLREREPKRGPRPIEKIEETPNTPKTP
jgi:hypothetical protein